MAASTPAVPASFKPLQHHIKTAAEHDARDPVVAYYCELFVYTVLGRLKIHIHPTPRKLGKVA